MRKPITPFSGGRFSVGSRAALLRSAESVSRKFQIQGIDLAQEPHLQGVVERVNRALRLGRTQMAVRMVQKELGHRNEATRILALLEEPQLTTVS